MRPQMQPRYGGVGEGRRDQGAPRPGMLRGRYGGANYQKSEGPNGQPRRGAYPSQRGYRGRNVEKGEVRNSRQATFKRPPPK